MWVEFLQVCGFTRLADAQAQLRAVRIKARDMGIDRVVIVLAATHANRRALREAAEAVAADYPTPTRAMLASLRDDIEPPASGIVFA